jgi:hypothetical protein
MAAPYNTLIKPVTARLADGSHLPGGAAPEAMLIAIGLQESGFATRDQLDAGPPVIGPATGFWQFERAGGVRAVMRHPASRDIAKMLIRESGTPLDEDAVWRLFATVQGDELACAFARLLLFTDPQALPAPVSGSEQESWNYYKRTWSPGQPRRESWGRFWNQACTMVAPADLLPVASPRVAHSSTLHHRLAEPVPISSILPINTGLSSAREHTMISVLGSPDMPLTRHCQNGRASDLVRHLLAPTQVAPNINVPGIRPAIQSLQRVLNSAFVQEPELANMLGTEGMLCVRLRKPTDGSVSTDISNHAWGTAIDFKLVGGDAPGNTGSHIPRFIAILVPFFNKEGWFSGIAFRDAMHFEVADQTIRRWSEEGLLA